MPAADARDEGRAHRLVHVRPARRVLGPALLPLVPLLAAPLLTRRELHLPLDRVAHADAAALGEADLVPGLHAALEEVVVATAVGAHGDGVVARAPRLKQVDVPPRLVARAVRRAAAAAPAVLVGAPLLRGEGALVVGDRVVEERAQPLVLGRAALHRRVLLPHPVLEHLRLPRGLGVPQRLRRVLQGLDHAPHHLLVVRAHARRLSAVRCVRVVRRVAAAAPSTPR